MILAALLRLGFPTAPDLFRPLTSHHLATRRSVLQKVRGRGVSTSSTACKHRVSGSLSLPSRGSFHRSLTVLSAIGHRVVFSLGRWSSLLPTGFFVSRGTLDTGWLSRYFAYRTVTFCGVASLPSSAISA